MKIEKLIINFKIRFEINNSNFTLEILRNIQKYEHIPNPLNPVNAW